MLRREGMTVEGGYSQTRCTPSRVSFMTGKYAWKVGLPGEIVLDYDSGNAEGCRILHRSYWKMAFRS